MIKGPAKPSSSFAYSGCESDRCESTDSKLRAPAGVRTTLIARLFAHQTTAHREVVEINLAGDHSLRE